MMLKRIQQMNKFEQRLQEENEACDSKIELLSSRIKGIVDSNRERGRPAFNIPDFSERISHVRRVVEHELNARDNPFFNKADRLL